ncbi:hypothetical protein V8E53_001857 [Lactarius tabidus]
MTLEGGRARVPAKPWFERELLRGTAKFLGSAAKRRGSYPQSAIVGDIFLAPSDGRGANWTALVTPLRKRRASFGCKYSTADCRPLSSDPNFGRGHPPPPIVAPDARLARPPVRSRGVAGASEESKLSTSNISNFELTEVIARCKLSWSTTSGGDWFGSDLRWRAWEDVPKLCPHALGGLASDGGASITRGEDRVNVISFLTLHSYSCPAPVPIIRPHEWFISCLAHSVDIVGAESPFWTGGQANQGATGTVWLVVPLIVSETPLAKTTANSRREEEQERSCWSSTQEFHLSAQIAKVLATTPTWR